MFAAAEAQRTYWWLHEKVDALGSYLAHSKTRSWFHGLSDLSRASYPHAPPSRGVKPLSDSELALAISPRFRLTLLNLGLHHCCSCTEHRHDFRDHADTCTKLAGFRARRYAIANDKGPMDPPKQVRLNPKRELAGLVENTPGRPSDTLIDASLKGV